MITGMNIGQMNWRIMDAYNYNVDEEGIKECTYLTVCTSSSRQF